MNLDRRTLLKGAGGLGVVAVGGAAMTGAGSADAHAETDYEVGDVDLSSDDGSIDYVAMHGAGTLEWIGFDDPATQVQIKTYASAYDNNNNEPLTDGETTLEDVELNDTGRIDLSEGEGWGNDDDELSGEGTRGYVHHGVGLDDGEHDPDNEWVLVGDKPDGEPGSDYGLPQNSLPAEPFTSGDDGVTESYLVVLETEYLLYHDSGAEEPVLTESTEGSIDLSVENIEEDAGTEDTDDDSGASGGTSNDGELDGAVYDTEE